MDLPTNNALDKPIRKNKPFLRQTHEIFQSPGKNIKSSHGTRTISSRKGQKASKRGVVSEDSKPERSDSMADSSTSGNEYRDLRRKYLLLEEESFGLEKELKSVEDDIKTLEEEKLYLLDELVVLEGLVDPLDINSTSRIQNAVTRGYKLQ